MLNENEKSAILCDRKMNIVDDIYYTKTIVAIRVFIKIMLWLYIIILCSLNNEKNILYGGEERSTAN